MIFSKTLWKSRQDIQICRSSDKGMYFRVKHGIVHTASIETMHLILEGKSQRKSPWWEKHQLLGRTRKGMFTSRDAPFHRLLLEGIRDYDMCFPSRSSLARTRLFLFLCPSCLWGEFRPRSWSALGKKNQELELTFDLFPRGRQNSL